MPREVTQLSDAQFLAEEYDRERALGRVVPGAQDVAELRDELENCGLNVASRRVSAENGA